MALQVCTECGTSCAPAGKCPQCGANHWVDETEAEARNLHKQLNEGDETSISPDDPLGLKDDEEAAPVSVADQKAAGVPADETVTIADQKAGALVPDVEPAAAGKADDGPGKAGPADAGAGSSDPSGTKAGKPGPRSASR
jgi:hypothetical protein